MSSSSSPLEQASKELQAGRFYIHKLSETFDSFQLHACSILSLAEQWRSLQAGFTAVNDLLVNRVKEFESNERENVEVMNKLGKLKESLVLRQKRLGMAEKSVKERVEEVEIREKDLKECYEVLELDRRDVEERRKAVASIERVRVCELRVEVERREKELEERIRVMEVKEKELEERIRAVEVRERGVVELREEVNERLKVLERKEVLIIEDRIAVEAKLEELERELSELLKRKEDVINDGTIEVELKEVNGKDVREDGKELEAKEREINAGWERLKIKEKEVNGRLEAVELREKRVEVKEGDVNERQRMLELEEKQMNDGFQVLELKEKWVDERVKEMKGKEVDELYQVGEVNEMDEPVKAIEITGEEASKLTSESSNGIVLEQKDAILNDGLRELREVQNDVPSNDAAKQIENETENQIQRLCKEMCGRSLQMLLNKWIIEQESMNRKLGAALGQCSDPAKLILTAVDGFYPPHLMEGSLWYETRIVRCSCLLLLEQLLNMKAVISETVKDEASKVAKQWRDNMRGEGETEINVLGFLLLIAAYDLGANYEVRELHWLFGIICQHRLAPLLDLRLLSKTKIDMQLDSQDRKRSATSVALPEHQKHSRVDADPMLTHQHPPGSAFGFPPGPMFGPPHGPMFAPPQGPMFRPHPTMFAPTQGPMFEPHPAMFGPPAHNWHFPHPHGMPSPPADAVHHSVSKQSPQKGGRNCDAITIQPQAYLRK